VPDTCSPLKDRQLSPTPSSATSPSVADSSTTDVVYLAPHEPRDEALSSKTDTSSSKIKKKFSELDIRGAMADLDIRKSGKRTGVEDFYIQLDEPHRMFWCPGETVKGRMPLSHANCSGQVNLILDRPVKTQFVILKLVGLLSVSMVREKLDYAIFEDEFVLWGTKVHGSSFDRTSDEISEYESPKKQKDEWETGIMEEGEHPFGFEFELPAKSMPSSIDVYPA
jgi:hypothetical protein